MLSGYHEPLLKLAKTFAPELIKDDTFGIFRIMGGQYNASDGVYTIYTGQADPRKYTYIDRWNGMREVNYWNKTGTCNMINGTGNYISLNCKAQGDPSLLDTVWGLQPDKHKHQTFLDVEPTTGLAMNVARRVQINMDVRPVPHIRMTGRETTALQNQRA
uniref:Uncharacterized protein n=1 Tax=Branchiostoma floridae TaxID=7739 RepID=C3ZKB6_BRAFL|eukprot:XP_002591004.1 hypothetical protein BRAFLDRAFT_69445 [Branchiostoma floridae]